MFGNCDFAQFLVGKGARSDRMGHEGVVRDGFGELFVSRCLINGVMQPVVQRENVAETLFPRRLAMLGGEIGQFLDQFVVGGSRKMRGCAHLQAFADFIQVLDLGERIIAHLNAAIGLANDEPDTLQLIKRLSNGVACCPRAGNDLVFHQPFARPVASRNYAGLKLSENIAPCLAR